MTTPKTHTSWYRVLEAARESRLHELPAEWLTQENLTCPDDEGWTPLFVAALRGHLDKIPSSLLTQANITLKNSRGITVLLLAATDGQLNCIPAHLLTQENMLMDCGGVTPLAWAAGMHFLDQVPTHLLTTENLTRRMGNGGTAINWIAALCLNFDQVPIPVLADCRNCNALSGGTTVYHCLSPELKAAVDAFRPGGPMEISRG